MSDNPEMTNLLFGPPDNPLDAKIWNVLVWFAGSCSTDDITKFKEMMEITDQGLDPEAKSAALQDLAYYNGAKAYAIMAAQSEEEAHEWVLGGCGGRHADALKVLISMKAKEPKS